MTTDSPATIGHLVIIGTGLIGGSFSLALQRKMDVPRITGVGRSQANLEQAKARGIIHDWTHDATLAVRDADVVLLAVPVASTVEVLQEIAPYLPAKAIVTDVGSTKQSVIADARRCLADISRFVPAHPLAGTEQSGALAAFAELYDDRWCLLTPVEGESDAASVQAVEYWWQLAGARVLRMPAAEHDDLLAAVSHLPHMAAYAVVNCVSSLEKGHHDPFQFAAGGFRDFTRIASSSPSMWRDIALCNRQALQHKIVALQQELALISTALEQQDGDALLDLFSAARDSREQWLETYGLKKDH